MDWKENETSCLMEVLITKDKQLRSSCDTLLHVGDAGPVQGFRTHS